MLDASFLLNLRINCARCRKEFPIPGVVREAMCGGCGELHVLDEAFWTSTLTAARFAEAVVAEDPLQKWTSGTIRARLVYQRRTPQCQACQSSELALRDVAAKAATGRWTCRQCNAVISVRPADDLVRSFHAGARFVVHEAEPLARPTSERAREHVFFVVCDYEEGELRDLQWAHGKKRLGDAARSGLAPRQYALLSDHADVEVRCALAGNASVPGDLLVKLAADRSERVRGAIVRNPNAPIAALLVLAADRDDDVQRAFADRTVIPVELVEPLASANAWQARKLAAHHPAVSEATLQRLCADAEPAVSTAAKSRSAARPAASPPSTGPALPASPPPVAAARPPSEETSLVEAADAFARMLAPGIPAAARPRSERPSRSKPGAAFYVAVVVVVLGVIAAAVVP